MLKKPLHVFKNWKLHKAYYSATVQSRLNEQVDFFGITHLLDNVVGISNTPSGYGKEFEGRELLNNTDIPLEQTIIVGDSMLDFSVSTALSIDCALLSNGHNNLERLQATGSKTFDNIQSFSDWILD